VAYVHVSVEPARFGRTARRDAWGLPPLVVAVGLSAFECFLGQDVCRGYCNITKCCTKVCPEHITITDNAIIPLKERVVDRFYDPRGRLLRVIRHS
jgi:hypothetical protein